MICFTAFLEMQSSDDIFPSSVYVFVDDAKILGQSLKVTVLGLGSLQAEAKPLIWALGLLYQDKFGSLVVESAHFVHVCGEEIEVLKGFTYIGSLVQKDGEICKEVFTRLAWPALLWTQYECLTW